MDKRGYSKRPQRLCLKQTVLKKKKNWTGFFPVLGYPSLGKCAFVECKMCIPAYRSTQTKAKRESLIKIRFLDVAQPCGAGKMIGLW